MEDDVKSIRWIETTEERYYEMLGVLPPASQAGAAFQVGEPMNHETGRPTFATFCERDGKFYESEDAVTFRAFKAEFQNAEYYYE
jgi:hypothetical protein